MREYQVQFEVAGPAAMWTQPDAGSAPVSYPGPTFSAAKGMFESIARLKSAYIRPTRIEICKPIRFHRYTNNYNGPLRKSNQIRGGDPYQLPAIVLADVCYRMYGMVEEFSPAPGGANHLHALQEIFQRRVENGQSFRPLCLGWSEFVPSYVGPFRAETQVEKSVSLVMPSMLHMVFDRSIGGRVAPVFRQNVEIREGVLEYAG